jgi:hypothetical protein
MAASAPSIEQTEELVGLVFATVQMQQHWQHQSQSKSTAAKYSSVESHHDMLTEAAVGALVALCNGHGLGLNPAQKWLASNRDFIQLTLEVLQGIRSFRNQTVSQLYSLMVATAEGHRTMRKGLVAVKAVPALGLVLQNRACLDDDDEDGGGGNIEEVDEASADDLARFQVRWSFLDACMVMLEMNLLLDRMSAVTMTPANV